MLVYVLVAEAATKNSNDYDNNNIISW